MHVHSQVLWAKVIKLTMNCVCGETREQWLNGEESQWGLKRSGCWPRATREGWWGKDPGHWNKKKTVLPNHTCGLPPSPFRFQSQGLKMNANVYPCKQNMSFWNSFHSNCSIIDIHIISSRVAYSFWIIENFYSEGEDFDGSRFIRFVLFF